VRNAFSSPDLGQLEMLVEKEFKNLNEREKTVKMVISKLESDFMRRYVEIRHDQL
jgi:F-type H+-transporting ATPase subunit epsilon